MSCFLMYMARRFVHIAFNIPRLLLKYVRRLRDEWQYHRRVELATNDPTAYYSSEYYLKECGGCECFGSGEIPTKFHFAASLLPEGASKKLTLDFACGRGEFTGFLNSKGVNVLGVDISPSAIEIAQKLYPMVAFKRIAVGEVPPGPFNAIFMIDVVEHMKRVDVATILCGLAAELESGGAICVHTNDGDQDGTSEIKRMHPEHILLFTARELAEVMRRAGLEVTLLLRRHRLEEGYTGGLWCVGRKSDRQKSQTERKVLIEYQATIGDQICLTPVIAEYRRKYPKDYIVVKVTHPEVYINNPHVDEIVWKADHPQDDFDIIHHIELPTARKYRDLMLQDASAIQLGLKLTNEQKRPQVFLSEIEREIWRKRFRRPDGLVVGFAPYTRWSSREWPLQRWREVTDWLQHEHKATFLYLGNDTRPYPWIGYNLGGLTDLRELALVLEQCDLLLSVDNGTTHLAAAVGTPTVAIYGPVLARTRVSVPWILPVQAKDCIGCYNTTEWITPPKVCPLKHHKCMKDIKPADVISACRQLLSDPNVGDTLSRQQTSTAAVRCPIGKY